MPFATPPRAPGPVEVATAFFLCTNCTSLLRLAHLHTCARQYIVPDYSFCLFLLTILCWHAFCFSLGRASQDVSGTVPPEPPSSSKRLRGRAVHGDRHRPMLGSGGTAPKIGDVMYSGFFLNRRFTGRRTPPFVAEGRVTTAEAGFLSRKHKPEPASIRMRRIPLPPIGRKPDAGKPRTGQAARPAGNCPLGRKAGSHVVADMGAGNGKAVSFTILPSPNRSHASASTPARTLQGGSSSPRVALRREKRQPVIAAFLF